MRLAGKRASMATKRVTINDIAAAAGVSKATVSRYLNGKNELISLPTQVRIKRAIEVSGYRLQRSRPRPFRWSVEYRWNSG